MLLIAVSTLVFFLEKTIEQARRIVGDDLVEAISDLRATAEELTCMATGIQIEFLTMVRRRHHLVLTPYAHHLFTSARFWASNGRPDTSVGLGPVALVVHLLLQVGEACAFICGEGRERWLRLEHVFDLVLGSGGFEEPSGGALPIFAAPFQDLYCIETGFLLDIIPLEYSHHFLTAKVSAQQITDIAIET